MKEDGKERGIEVERLVEGLIGPVVYLSSHQNTVCVCVFVCVAVHTCMCVL